MSARLSARKNLDCGRIFLKFYIWVVFENLSRKMEAQLQPDKNKGYFTQWRTQEFCFFFGGGGLKQIQFKTEDRENGDLGAIAP